jgi:hypothetical protein
MATQEMILKLSFDDEGTFTGLSDINQELAKTDTATQALEKSTKTLKAQYAELKKQQDQMDPGTEKFAKLSVQMGELKDRMNDAADAVKGNTGPAIEGARASFGMMGEQMANLDFEGLGQSLNLISGNLARLKPEDISKGFKSMADAGMNAFKAIGKVIMANPILAIAGIIIAIAMNFDKLIKLFPGLEKSLKGINEEERKTLDIAKAKAAASQKVYENVDKQSNILKQQGKTEKEILQIKLKALETAIADRKAQLLITEKQAITQVETAKRNREILEGIIRFLTAPIQILLSAVDGIAGMLGQESKLAEGFTDLAAGLLIDPDEMEAELAKTIQENKDAIGTMENDYAGLQNSIADIDKKASDDKKKLNAEAKAEQDKLNEEAKQKALAEALTVDQRLQQVEKDRADSRKSAIDKELDDLLALQKTEEAKYRAAAKSEAEMQSLKIRHSQELQGVLEKYAKLEQAKLDEDKKKLAQQTQDLQKIIDAADERNIMQHYTKQQQELIANDVYYQQLISQAEAAGLVTAALTEEQARKENEIKEKYRKEDAEKRMANISAGFEMASLGLDALMSLNQAAAKGDEASQRKTFERNKLMQKAQATIAMAAGIVQQLGVPQDQLTGMNFVKAAAIAAAGIANIVKINQTQFTGGSPPSTTNLNTPTGGGGNAPAIDFSGANIANNAPGGLETYVLAGNVANALEARQKIIDQSHL